MQSYEKIMNMQGVGDDAVKDYRDRRDDSNNDTDSGFFFVPFVSQVSSVPFNPFLSCTSLAPLPHHVVVSPFGRGNAQFVINIYPLGRNDLELSKILAKFVV